MDERTRQALLSMKAESSIHDIVYLEDDKYTYEYFLTGKFDAQAREKELRTQQEQFNLSRGIATVTEKPKIIEESKNQKQLEPIKP